MDHALARQDALFDATITPSSPVTARGLLGVTGGLVAVCAVAMLAVWPFSSWLAVALAVTTAAVIHWLCRIFDEARTGVSETIRLDRRGLTVMRRRADGRFDLVRMEPFWTRVAYEQGGELKLVAGAKAVVVGVSLSEDERAGLAAELGRALRRYRTGGFAPA
jgi:uncharacterized membrane protein